MSTIQFESEKTRTKWTKWYRWCWRWCFKSCRRLSESVIIKKQCFFLYLFLERQVEDVAKCCCTCQKTSVLGTDTTNNLCNMWVTDSCYQNKRPIEDASGHHQDLLDPALFHFTKDDQTFTWLALKLQASNPETRKRKKIDVDMEDAIFNGVQSLFQDVSKLYCVCHMEQRDEIKIGKFFAKFKYSENEKVFKVNHYWREEI